MRVPTRGRSGLRIVLATAAAITVMVFAAGQHGSAWDGSTFDRADRPNDLTRPQPVDNGFQETVLQAYSPTLTPDAGWTSFVWYGDGLVFNEGGPFVFETDTAVTLRITDDFCAGDQFRVYDHGVELEFEDPLRPGTMVRAPTTFHVDEAGGWGIGPDAAFRANWMSSGIYQLGPGKHAIMIQVIENPWGMGRAYLRIDTEHPMQAFDLETVSSTYAQVHGQDRFRFVANTQLAAGSDGMFPALEELVLWYGRYLEVIPAGEIVCDTTECTYDSNGSGIQSVRIVGNSIAINGDFVDLCPGGNPHFVALWIGNDGAAIPVRCEGTLRNGAP